jgi:dTDP-4-dehydrorhamnose reductase
MNKVLITGANGQLGSEIRELETQHQDYKFYFTDISNLDLTNHSAVKTYIEEKDIAIIINCAAYTAVDKAETEVELSDKLNHLAVKNLAAISKARNIKLVHVSTDYVFDGFSETPYLTSDTPNPQGVYGSTKLAGEQALIEINSKNSIIIRTSWVYSSFGNNFVKTMLRLAKDRDTLNVVADQVGSPTYAADLAKAILEILPKLKNNTIEIYHYTNQGVCSWYEFAKAIFEINDIHINVLPITTVLYPTPAKRPTYSVLNTNTIKEKYNINIPFWRDSLKTCLKEIKKL